jgi:23S rRNA (cytidine1920-2'-O)/16S rRNA (cytidine1409-2'-O)-methyltransferase
MAGPGSLVTAVQKLRLDQLLVARGLFPDAGIAASWIMARKVRVRDQYLTKPGTLVPVDASIEVVGLEQRYVSRGGAKLEAALDRFEVSPRGRVVLDAGASTGGFTDCLLQRGAALVYSVDVGFGQLRGSLASHSRVEVLERTNIGTLTRESLARPLDLCVADLSYLSVSKSLPILLSLFERSPLIVHLVKPLFEGLRPEEALDREAIEPVLLRLAEFAERSDVHLSDLMASPILGSGGTVEFFALFSAKAGPTPLRDLVDCALGGIGRGSR